MKEDSDGGMCNPFLYINCIVTLFSGQYYMVGEFWDIPYKNTYLEYFGILKSLYLILCLVGFWILGAFCKPPVGRVGFGLGNCLGGVWRLGVW